MNPEIQNALIDPETQSAAAGVGGFFGILLFMWRRTIGRLDAIEISLSESKTELSTYKLHVESSFAKNSSIDRLNERLDQINSTINSIYELLASKR